MQVFHRVARVVPTSETGLQARRQLNWNGGGGMDSQYIVLSELLSDQAAFITSPKQVWRIIGGHCPPAPSVYGPAGLEGRYKLYRVVFDHMNNCVISPYFAHPPILHIPLFARNVTNPNV